MILFVPAARNRQSIRLRSYDYSRIGAYFVTLCTEERWCLLGAVTDGAMRLNDAGRMVEAVWHSLPNRFQAITIDAFVVMPNHIHGIIVISNDEDDRGGECRGDHKDRPYGWRGASRGRGESCIRPSGRPDPASPPDARPHGTLPGTIGRIMQAFKSVTTHEYAIGVRRYGWVPFAQRFWQRNYYDHIIRNEKELTRIREYIVNNPARWELDHENPNRVVPAGSLDDEEELPR